MTAAQFIRSTETQLLTQTHKDLSAATPQELHMAISAAAMDALAPVWKKREEARSAKR